MTNSYFPGKTLFLIENSWSVVDSTYDLANTSCSSKLGHASCVIIGFDSLLMIFNLKSHSRSALSIV